MKNTPYWLDVPLIKGSSETPKGGGIVIVGSGLAGVSTAYWLLKGGFEDITILDYKPETPATNRNGGHILHGSVESPIALKALHGEETFKDIWNFSIGLCDRIKETVLELGLKCDYRQDGYLVIAVDKTEDEEIKNSISLLNKYGFTNRYLDENELNSLGFKNVLGARYEAGSAQAHPVKFRNELLKHCLNMGLSYYTGVKVESIDETSSSVDVRTNKGVFTYDAGVIAANAYSPLLNDFYKSRSLVEPFKGQIIVSSPLKHQFKFTAPHSFDHGYEYALVTPDNRLLIGGWRNHVPGAEIGTYNLNTNPDVETGLQDFVKQYYEIKEDITWEYSWTGIMAASSTGMPFIGPVGTSLFTCAGFTGHGFSWAHGSARLLADIMLGNPYPKVAKYFNPKK